LTSSRHRAAIAPSSVGVMDRKSGERRRRIIAPSFFPIGRGAMTLRRKNGAMRSPFPLHRAEPGAISGAIAGGTVKRNPTRDKTARQALLSHDRRRFT